jgi:hypothetical protein
MPPGRCRVGRIVSYVVFYLSRLFGHRRRTYDAPDPELYGRYTADVDQYSYIPYNRTARIIKAGSRMDDR